jgi:hypothetical protein
MNTLFNNCGSILEITSVEQDEKMIMKTEKASVFKEVESLEVLHPDTDLERQTNHE